MTPTRFQLISDNEKLKSDLNSRTFELVRLLNYVINMQEDHPDFDWPDLPDRYSELLWRYVV